MPISPSPYECPDFGGPRSNRPYAGSNTHVCPCGSKSALEDLNPYFLVRSQMSCPLDEERISAGSFFVLEKVSGKKNQAWVQPGL